MRFAIVFCLLLSASTVFAAETKMKLNAVNKDILSLLQEYSKASGQKFIIDSTVRGKITLLNQDDVPLDEAFNQIAEGLALNGFTIIKNENIISVRNARSAQRDNIEVSETVPAAKPQRMATWIVNLKYASAETIQQQLRLLTSSYGEMSAYSNTNQIIISDFTGNLQRISEMIKKIDVSAAAKK